MNFIETIKNGVQKKNMGSTERVISAAVGALALGYAFKKTGRGKIPLLIGAASLLQRGATGSCSLYRALGVDRSTTHDTRDWTEPGKNTAVA